jgi:hypothetical protein
MVAMTTFEIFVHVAPKTILASIPVMVAFYYLERYIDRRKDRDE